VRFDSTRGYGFIAPDSGGEDLFLHVNDLRIPESSLRTGLAVEFDVEDGGRGLKAANIRFAQAAEEPTVPGAPVTRAVPVKAADGEPPMCDVLTSEEFSRDITELLLKAGSSLTADQILQLRHELMKFGESHGWIED
jgi:cold shock CspA family protein